MFRPSMILAIGAIVLLFLTGCMAQHPGAAAEVGESGTPDMRTERLSDANLFRVSYRSELSPMAINTLHRWILHVETAEGQPVDAASITVNGGMPEHNHGLPTQPLVTESLGDGDYRVEGMKFQMPGRWVVTFVIDAGEQQDSVTFNLMLN